MKHIIYSIIGLFLISFYSSCFTSNKQVVHEEIPIIEKLADIEWIKVQKVRTPPNYKEAFRLTITQPIDYNNVNGGTFEQRVWFSFKGYDRPTVIITDGYSSTRNRISEIAELTDANQILVEHRYFGKSVPDTLDWSKLNLFQACNDLHRIRTLLDPIFRTAK